ncbi:MAG: hypothetical protein ABIU95_10480, partial [Burkholderiales bacterium]
AYAATRWVVDAIQKAGTFDSGKVSETLAGSSFDFHPYGKAAWGGEKTYGIRRQILTPLPASIIRGGKWEVLDVRMAVLE